MSTNRNRNFACLVYQDSAPADWLERLEALHVPAYAVLHDKDEGVKPHYHILLCYSGVKSIDQVKADVETFGGLNQHIENVKDRRGYLMYMTHIGTNKHLYPAESVISLWANAYIEEIGSISDNDDLIKDICVFCDKEDITSFYVLCCKIRDNPRWLKILVKRSFFFNSYINSRREWMKGSAES